MAKQKKLIEYRYYEIPHGHYVLPLIGPQWERAYGVEYVVEKMLHFHNYLEIGYCYWGNGELTVDETVVKYKGGLVTIIPENIPHTTQSAANHICKWEYLFIDINGFIQNEMSFKRYMPDDIIKMLNKQARVLQWKQYPAISSVIKNIIEEYREKKPHYKEAVSAYLRAFVVEMMRITEEMSAAVTFAEARHSNYIELGVKYISEHYAEDIKMNEIAQICRLSESHFRRMFEETMQMKPLDYVNMVRIDKACELLKNEEVGMEEVGYRVGYQTPSTFNRNFKKLTGKTPYQWKREDGNDGLNSKNYKISALKGW